MVGMRTSMAMDVLQCLAPWPGTLQVRASAILGLPQGSTGGPAGSFRRRAVLPHAPLPGDPYFFLADLAVHDTALPELGPVRFPGADQHVVLPPLAGAGAITSRR